MSKKKPSIVFALLGYGSVHARAAESFANERVYASQQGYRVASAVVNRDAMVCRTRSRVAQHFIDDNYDVLVFQDRDIDYQRGDLVEAAHAAHTMGAVVSGIYAKKKQGSTAAVILAEDLRVPIGDKNTSQIVKAYQIPGGALCIPRCVFEQLTAANESLRAAIKKAAQGCELNNLTRLLGLVVNYVEEDGEKYWHFFRPFCDPISDSATMYRAEDGAFSARCRYANIPMYVSTKLVIGHTGEKRYTLEDSTHIEMKQV